MGDLGLNEFFSSFLALSLVFSRIYRALLNRRYSRENMYFPSVLTKGYDKITIPAVWWKNKNIPSFFRTSACSKPMFRLSSSFNKENHISGLLCNDVCYIQKRFPTTHSIDCIILCEHKKLFPINVTITSGLLYNNGVLVSVFFYPTIKSNLLQLVLLIVRHHVNTISVIIT